MTEAIEVSSLTRVPKKMPAINPWIVVVTVTLAPFMEVLDFSIANVALPHIAGTLGATSEESTWIITSYLVSSAIVLPMSGWLSNIIGRKRFYMMCVAMFTISSFLCGGYRARRTGRSRGHARESVHGSAVAEPTQLCHCRFVQLHSRHRAERKHHNVASVLAE
jgi:hypothetical protein